MTTPCKAVPACLAKPSNGGLCQPEAYANYACVHTLSDWEGALLPLSTGTVSEEPIGHKRWVEGPSTVMSKLAALQPCACPVLRLGQHGGAGDIT